MLSNGRTQLFPDNQRSSGDKSGDFSLQLSERSLGLASDEGRRQNGLNIETIREDQSHLKQLGQTISSNINNNKTTWLNKMASVSGNQGQQAATNTNGYPQPLAKNSSSLNNIQSVGTNKQIPSNTNQSPASLMSGGDTSNNTPSSSQYNAFNTNTQDVLLQDFRARNASHDINPMMRHAPTTSEQYGSPQQRSYMSGQNNSPVRGLNRQNNSPFPKKYFPQETHNKQAVARVEKPKSEERNSNEPFQWPPQSQRYPSTIQTNAGQSHSHSPMQSGMSARQPPPYMMVGQGMPSQSPQYMMASQMKANSIANPSPPYYGRMGSMMQRPPGMQNQMQNPPQDYGSYQQQSYYPQPQYPSSLPQYMQSRQQSMSQAQSSMSRMMPTQQAILPKPSMDMYTRYPNNISSEQRMQDYQGPPMNDHIQQQPQHRQQQPYPSQGPVGPDAVNHRGYYPGYPSSPSPNVTMGSPLRNLPEGFPNNSSNLPTMPGTPTFPNTPPPQAMPYSSGAPTSTNAAAAAAAAVMQAANSRYPPAVGHQSSEPPAYQPRDATGGMRGRVPVSANSGPSLPGMDGGTSSGTIETGRVESPTLNMLPTAEDVEAMIQSMSSEDACMDDVSSQSTFVPTSKHDLANETIASSSPAQNVTRTTTNTSPLSSFSEELPSPGVSITSFCDDDNDEMNVPVDDITPTLGQSTNVTMNKTVSKDQPQFGKYSQLYEISDEPDRKEFLDKYALFMESTGNTVKQVPVFNHQLLDIYKLYKVIKANGGLQEVVKRKLWDKILISLNISPDQTVLSNQLRSHYSRFLLAYEMTDVVKSTHPTPAVENLLDDTGIPPPNATVTCSEVLFPAPSMSVSNVYPVSYNQPASTNGPQSYGGYNYNEGYQVDGKYNMSHNNTNYNMPQYQQSYDRTNNYTNYPGYPGQPAASQSQYPGSTALSQLLQQRGSNVSNYQPMTNQPPPRQPQQDYTMWGGGGQYKASSEPDHMFDYPPKQHYPPNRQQYQQTPPQYRQSPPPHGSRSPSLPRQPMLQSQPQVSKLKMQPNNIKKEVYFPQESVEATKPVFTKKRKLTSRDLGPVEAWRVMMSLKSGLLSETTWALDALNILLYDDHTVGYFLLSHLPGLLDNLLDHFRRYLVEIFGPFWDNQEEISQSAKDWVNLEAKDDKLHQDVCRSLSAFIAASSMDFEGENGDDLLCGSSRNIKHIQTHLGNDDKYNAGTISQSCQRLYDDKSHPEGRNTNQKDTKPKCNGEHCEVSLQIKNEDNSKDSCQKQDGKDKTLQDFTERLRKELDLDIESSDDSDTETYIQSVIETHTKRRKNLTLVEEESIRSEESTLSLRTEKDNVLARRVMCISNILRGLSFVPGNDVEMFRHSGLLLILGKLLLLNHQHAVCISYRHSFMKDEVQVDAPTDDKHDWWWSSLEVLRENALVIFSNIAGQLDLCVYPKTVSGPILDGLLHWFICQSAEALDPMPTATISTSLSARQLVLETLAKMSILGGNTELILSTSSSCLEQLYTTLVRLLGQRDNAVSRELSLVVLSNLSQSDNEYTCLTDKKQCIAMLLHFIEDAANSINAYSSGGTLAQAGFHSEDFCGTSVDMLRRAASTLVCLARSKPIRSLFLPYQERLLLLTTLKLLERMIGSQLAEVLYYLSR